jgi:hypothetical protein
MTDNTGISYGKSDYSGLVGPCVAKEFISNGISVMKNVLVTELSYACFTETITQQVVNIDSEPCTVTTRIESLC